MPADVSYGFDADTLVVWLDAFQADTGARAGVLCRRHADAMVVPLGWMLDDRRDPVPRLFRSVAEAPTRPAARRVRHERPPVVQLSLEADDATGELIISPERLAAAMALDDTAEIVRPRAPARPRPVPSPRPAPPVLELVPEPAAVPAPVPVVAPMPEPVVEPEPARAEPIAGEPVEPVEPVEPAEPVEAELVEDELVDVDPAHDEPDADDTVILPWQPRFDQSDDLKGLLKARGRLLSRAFGGRAADGG